METEVSSCLQRIFITSSHKVTKLNNYTYLSSTPVILFFITFYPNHIHHPLQSSSLALPVLLCSIPSGSRSLENFNQWWGALQIMVIHLNWISPAESFSFNVKNTCKEETLACISLTKFWAEHQHIKWYEIAAIHSVSELTNSWLQLEKPTGDQGPIYIFPQRIGPCRRVLHYNHGKDMLTSHYETDNSHLSTCHNLI